MISPEELKYATDFIISTLKDLRMSKYTIRVYSLHYQELHNYVKDKALVEVDDCRFLAGCLDAAYDFMPLFPFFDKNRN